MDLRGVAVKRAAGAFALMFALAAGSAGAQTPPPTLVFDGQLLVIVDRYLVVSSGDALHLAADAQFTGIAPKPGRFVRVTIDPRTHDVVAISVAAHAYAGGKSVTEIPRDLVAVDPRSARKSGSIAAAGSGQIVQVTIVVAVPANTPTGDVVYFTSDRSNFSVAETRMDQIDALHWSLTLPLLEGTTLRYKFSRGSYTATERDRAGADVPSRSLVARAGVKTNDVVLRWADLR